MYLPGFSVLQSRSVLGDDSYTSGEGVEEELSLLPVQLFPGFSSMLLVSSSRMSVENSCNRQNIKIIIVIIFAQFTFDLFLGPSYNIFLQCLKYSWEIQRSPTVTEPFRTIRLPYAVRSCKATFNEILKIRKEDKIIEKRLVKKQVSKQELSVELKIKGLFHRDAQFPTKTTNRVLKTLCLKHLVKQPLDSEDNITTATKSLTRFIRHFHQHFRHDRFHVTQNQSKSKIILRRSRSSSTRVV